MQPDSGYEFQDMVFHPFILSLNFPEHLKVTTRLGASIISSPVAGFRPLRSRLPLTQKAARDDLIISRMVSTVSVDCFLVNPFRSAMALIMWTFVRAMAGVSLMLKG
jgi:hypothetical protein